MRLSEKTLAALKGEVPMPPWLWALAPAAGIYSLAARARAGLYRRRIFDVKRLPCPVISVGNLAPGGTGKTPFVIFLCRLLQEKGYGPAVVTRGYGGALEGDVMVVSDGRDKKLSAHEAGDEASLLAAVLPGVPVVMGTERYEAGMLAVEKFKPGVVVLDDGYQHMSLARDLNILLLDASRPFGNGFTLPAGYLREPKNAVKRADLVVLTRAEDIPGASAAAVKMFAPSAPVITAAHRPGRLYRLDDNSTLPLATLSETPLLAVSSIAAPASFTLILQKLNAKIAGVASYPDHHRYTDRDVSKIKELMTESGARAAVTTEKDAVKLAALGLEGIEVLVLRVELEILDGAGVLAGLLEEKVLPD